MSPDVPTAILAGIFALALYGMWRGWRARASRTALTGFASESAPAPTAADLGDARGPAVPGVYASTVGQDWLDRVTAHELGSRAEATAQVFDGGIVLSRRGASDVLIPAAEVRGADLAGGIAGKVVGGRRVVVVDWQHAGHDLQTGFLPRFAADRDPMVAAVRSLIAHPAASPAATEETHP